MKKLLLYMIVWVLWIVGLGFSWNITFAAPDSEDSQSSQVAEKVDDCKWGIKLLTNFPLIWKCIRIKRGNDTKGISPTQAFPTMVAALTKIVMSVILVVCLILIILWWIMISSDNKLWEWKALIKKVAVVILLLWFSSLILKLVNPNFFG